MEVKFVDIPGGCYLEGIEDKTCLNCEQDVLSLLVLCSVHGTNRVLFFERHVPEDFFDLRSGHAGKLLQKFANYHIKAALVLASGRLQGRFGEFVTETNRGNQFRVFPDKNGAEQWLVSN